MLSALRAVEEVRDGDVVGLGSGRAATAFLVQLAERVAQGLRVRGVATSVETTRRAGTLNVPLVTLEEVELIDITVDGADEVDLNLDLIKGYGGALLREKVVACCSRRRIILVGREKLVPTLGFRGKLPVEVVPFAVSFCQSKFREFGIPATVRTMGGRPFITDNGNLILDCAIGPIEDARSLEQQLCCVPGVAATGLFLDFADMVFVESDEPTGSVEVRTK